MIYILPSSYQLPNNIQELFATQVIENSLEGNDTSRRDAFTGAERGQKREGNIKKHYNTNQIM